MGQIKPVLIFDGDCGFCTTTASYIRQNSSTPIEIHPWQFIDVTKYGLTQEQTMDRVFVVEGVKTFGGHRAFAKILLLQKNPLLKIVGALVMYPPISFFARPAYSLVAKYRHKLPGGTPACKIEPR
jgi:predicted DCC family thiol-disulfide oxidoreductase YuxK